MNFFTQLLKAVRPKKSYPLILVTGAPKTGTTAVYHSIKNGLPPESTCLFEPENRDLKLPDEINSPVLVKSFVKSRGPYDHFNKKILIVRDPRDHVISYSLYAPYNIVIKNLQVSENDVETFLKKYLSLIKMKEKDPASVPFMKIYKLLSTLQIHDYGKDIIEYYTQNPKAFILRYEDYIEGRLNELKKYLSLPIEKVNKVPETRVIRSKTYGNWKNWFTTEDVEYFREIFAPYMQTFGYKDNWELNPEPFINPEISSLYIEKLVSEASEHSMIRKSVTIPDN